MIRYLYVFGRPIALYGFMIVLGAFVANFFAYKLLKKRDDAEVADLILMEAYTFAGGMLGAKLLFILTIFGEIDWSRFFEPENLNTLLNGGFVFYGGLIGGILCVAIMGHVHKIETMKYVRNFIFGIPLVHAFGRVGCFFAGCCYGIEYHGPLAVVFPENGYTPHGIELFPVQLFEAALLFILAMVIFYLRYSKNYKYTLELYIVAYAIIRFGTEFLRGDINRGFAGVLSTSQWISILTVAVLSVYIRFFAVKEQLQQ